MRFEFSRGFRFFTYFSIVLFFALAVTSLYVGLFMRQSPNLNIPAVFGIAAMFVVAGIYQISITPRLREAIVITDDGIAQELANGSKVTIRWKEVARLKERPFLGRLELISIEPTRVVRIEHQIRGFPDLVALLLHHLESSKLIAEQGSKGL